MVAKTPVWKYPIIAANQAKKAATPNIGGYGSVAGHPRPPQRGPFPKPPTASAASSPAAPAAPAAPTAASWQDSTYNQAISNLQSNLNNLKPALTAAGTSLQAEYGINGPAFNPDTYDPNNPGSFSIADNVDVTNPFSRAAALKKAYQAQSRGDTNNLAARGQLYAGSLQNAQNTDTQNLLSGQNSLLTDFANKYGSLYSQWLNAKNTEASGETQAGSDALTRWAAAGYPGAVPSAGATTPAADAVPGSVSSTHPAGVRPAGTTVPVGSGGGPQKKTVTPGSPVKPKPVKRGALSVVKPKGGK